MHALFEYYLEHLYSLYTLGFTVHLFSFHFLLHRFHLQTEMSVVLVVCALVSQRDFE